MKPSEIKDYYERLGLSRNASQDEIQRAYRRFAMNYHPDRNHGNKEAETQFKAVSEAYSTLNDTLKRAEYDALSILKTVKQEPVKSNKSTTMTDVPVRNNQSATMADLFRALNDVQKEGMSYLKTYFNIANKLKKHSKKTIDTYL